MHFTLFVIFICFILNSCSSTLSEPIISFQVQTPRPFGYVIGDEIKQRIVVDVRDGMALQYNSLPNKGKVNRWLNLNKIKIDKNKIHQGIHYQIDLTYQLFYAPLEVKMLKIPSFTLQFKQFGNTTKKQVPYWNFTTAPLRELAIRKDEGKEYMRPDSPAPLLDYTASYYRLLVSLLIAFIITFYLAWLYGCLSFLPKYQIFKRPAKRLSQLPNTDIENMLRVMHRALNQLNGKPLFQHQLADFYNHHPSYQQLNNELNWFFKYSNQYFFSTNAPVNKTDSNKIKELCQHCLEIERGKR